MAKFIDGNEIAKEVLKDVTDGLSRIRERNPNFSVTLAIVQVRSPQTLYNFYLLVKIKIILLGWEPV
jgi:5,10-methylene-tetrahydrofolate dehydrogenase/methenyl tetrahydrofolate cyclohydrolase